MLAEAEAARTSGLAEAAKLDAETRQLTTDHELAKINLAREHHRRAKELATDEFHFRYLFNDQVTESSAQKCVQQLSQWERRAGGQKLTIALDIDSPGGSIFDGLHLFDYIRAMQSRGHVIDTTAYGMAASMAGVLLQVGNTRRLSMNSALLIHEAQFIAYGSFGSVMDEVELVKMLHERILDIFATRAKEAKGSRAMTKAQIKRRWHRKDWWLSAEEAEKYGFVDEVV